MSLSGTDAHRPTACSMMERTGTGRSATGAPVSSLNDAGTSFSQMIESSLIYSFIFKQCIT